MQPLASMSDYVRVTAPLRSRPRIAGRWVLSPVVLQAACRLHGLVAVLACGEDAGVSGPGSSLRPKAITVPEAVFRHLGGTRRHVVRSPTLPTGFNPATAVVLCLR